MIRCTYNYKPRSYTVRIQELVKILELKSFRFLWTIKHEKDNTVSAEYTLNDEDYKKLNMYLIDNEIKQWSKWKYFVFKIQRIISSFIK
jgi:hypothetical protein